MMQVDINQISSIITGEIRQLLKNKEWLLPPVRVHTGQIVIVEGSYSCHPALWSYYDLHIFLTGRKKFERRRR